MDEYKRFVVSISDHYQFVKTEKTREEAVRKAAEDVDIGRQYLTVNRVIKTDEVKD